MFTSVSEAPLISCLKEDKNRELPSVQISHRFSPLTFSVWLPPDSSDQPFLGDILHLCSWTHPIFSKIPSTFPNSSWFSRRGKVRRHARRRRGVPARYLIRDAAASRTWPPPRLPSAICSQVGRAFPGIACAAFLLTSECTIVR